MVSYKMMHAFRLASKLISMVSPLRAAALPTSLVRCEQCGHGFAEDKSVDDIMAGANKKNKTKQKRGLRIENSSMIVQRLYKSGTRRHCHASSLQADLIESDQDLERNSLSEHERWRAR